MVSLYDVFRTICINGNDNKDLKSYYISLFDILE